jgi:ketosteroid isomerase-like protein
MIDRDVARRFAEEWIASWNAHDLERILSHYTDDFEMHSPLIVERMGVPSGCLRGKDAVRPYWAAGLAARPGLHFTLVEVLVGVDALTILYRSELYVLVAETIGFDDRGRAVRGSAHYGPRS